MELDVAVKRLLVKEPFYGLFLLNLNRYYGDKCSTACVCRNGINTELCVNKEFWNSLNDDMQLSILKHEINKPVSLYSNIYVKCFKLREIS